MAILPTLSIVLSKSPQGKGQNQKKEPKKVEAHDSMTQARLEMWFERLMQMKLQPDIACVGAVRLAESGSTTLDLFVF